MISTFDIFKIGIGPSSSHTVAPMKAGKQFVDDLIEQNQINRVKHIRVDVYGSLSLTGIGHGTDVAIVMGLAGYLPHDVDIDLIPHFIENVKKNKILPIGLGCQNTQFDYEQDMVFHHTFLPLHENGMSITAFGDSVGKSANQDVIYRQTYYSIGGGFIVDEAHFGQTQTSSLKLPYPYQHASDVLKYCQENQFNISDLMMANEVALCGGTESDVHARLQTIWATMLACIERGLATEGVLPGPLKVTRRAPQLHRRLTQHPNSNDPMAAVDWINMYALAVNEENAAGGRVVTAPTNGACGIVPAVLMYYAQYWQPLTPEIISRYLLTAGLIGTLYKMNASISGAEVGCQGEVGVACSMAAGALTALKGGDANQICIAAEIAMEHNLGLTCDPVGGQVQVPCIERNAIGAVKAVNAARMAMMREGQVCVDLDKVIATMYETGKDMNAKYRETSQGGLAVKIVCA